MLLAPIAGWLVDRTEATRALRYASAFQAIVALGLAFASGLPAILVLVFLLGVGASVAGPATFTLVPEIVHGGDPTRANAMMESARYTGWVLGPIAAGVLAQTSSTSTALVLDAATFVVIAAATTIVRVRKPGIPDAERERPLREMSAGVRLLGRDRLLLAIVVVVAGTVVFAAMDNVAEVFFSYDVLGSGGFGLGALATGFLLGMVFGAAWVAPRIAVSWQARILGIAAILGGAAIFVVSQLSTLAAAVAMFAVAGVANGVQNVTLRSVVHRRAPEDVRGRVFAAYSGLTVGAQLSATAIAGPIVAEAGARTALAIGGLGTLAVGLIGTVWLLIVERDTRASEPSDW